MPVSGRSIFLYPPEPVHPGPRLRSRAGRNSARDVLERHGKARFRGVVRRARCPAQGSGCLAPPPLRALPCPAAPCAAPPPWLPVPHRPASRHGRCSFATRHYITRRHTQRIRKDRPAVAAAATTPSRPSPTAGGLDRPGHGLP